MEIKDLRKTAYNNISLIIGDILTLKEFDFENKLEIVKFRVKTEESLIKKCNKLNIKPENCHDLIGVRFIVSNTDDCYELCGIIKRNKNMEFVEVRDYIKTPQNNGPYRALHLLVKYNNIPCEIQLLSHDMYNLAKGNHDKYKNGDFNC